MQYVHADVALCCRWKGRPIYVFIYTENFCAIELYGTSKMEYYLAKLIQRPLRFFVFKPHPCGEYEAVSDCSRTLNECCGNQEKQIMLIVADSREALLRFYAP
jgi:hypothetical protein